MHQDALSLHGLPLESEIFCRVDDSAIGLILDTDVLLTLEGDRAELEELWVETQVR